MLPLKRIGLALDPCGGGLLGAAFYIQFIVLFRPFNLMYCSLRSDVRWEGCGLGRFFVITLYYNIHLR
jgi:hypothetical protein